MIEIQPITRESYRQAARVLGEAFIDDPVSVAAYPGYSPGKRVQALTTDFLIELKVCMRRGYPIEAMQDGRLVGAAVIYPPGSHPLPVIDQWMILLKSVIRNGFYDFRNWLNWLNEAEKYHPTQEHYYLVYLGAEPAFQGKGVGSALLGHLIERSEADAVGCYLENANPRNIPFYQRAGFSVLEEKVIIGIPTWFMWRAPDAHSPHP